MFTHLKQCVKDTAASVRASGCRTLGVFVTFPCLRDDVQNMEHTVTDLHTLLNDEVLNVRIRACWALANMCDSIRHAKWCNEQTPHAEPIIVNASLLVLNSCCESDKVRANSVRALGNVASFAWKHILNRRLRYDEKAFKYSKATDINDPLSMSLEQGLCKELLSSLASSNVKVRWNACYAFGHFINNDRITISTEPVVQYVFVLSNSLPLIRALCHALTTDKNFKVRIQASWALSFLKPSHGITCQVTAWNCVLQAVTASTGDTDFKEYKYVKTLMHQLRLTIIHLLDLSQFAVDVTEQIKGIMSQQADTIAQVLREEAHYLLLEMKDSEHVYKIAGLYRDWLQQQPKKQLLAIESLNKMIKNKDQHF